MITLLLILLSILFIVISTTRFHLHPFLALLFAALLFGFLSGMQPDLIIDTISEGFGSTVGSIGIIIIAGVIIGAFLENSGGAYKLASVVLNLVGQKRIHAAMAIVGYIVSIPVFADSGFIILASLNKALSKTAHVSLSGTSIALSLGLMATHTMVPPTPGPIAAAGIIQADLGRVILIGLYASICSLLVVILFSKYIGKRINIDPEPTLADENIHRRKRDAPSALKSFVPIVIPILLIVLKSVAEFPTDPFGSGKLKAVFTFVGDPVVALLIGMILSFSLPKKLDAKTLDSSGWIGEALKNGAVIILITGAGGAFGKVLQNSGIGQILGGWVEESSLGLWLPFLIAAGIKSAQGSSTVALITTASLVAPLMSSMGMDSEISRAMTVIAIGAGSAVVSHANDSFFWVVTQMSNMNVKQGYQIQSLGSGILGLSAMIFLTILDLFI